MQLKNYGWMLILDAFVHKIQIMQNLQCHQCILCSYEWRANLEMSLGPIYENNKLDISIS